MSDFQSDDNLKEETRTTKNAVGTGIRIANGAAKAKGTSLISSLFANPTVLIVVGVVLLVSLIFMLFRTSVASPTLFNDDNPDIGEVKISLDYGYVDAKEKSMEYVVDKIKEKYPELPLTYDDIPTYDDGFCLSGDNDKTAYEIQVNFDPDIGEFAELINAYANGVNGAITLFEGTTKAKELNDEKIYTPESSILDYDPESGSFSVSSSTKNKLDSYNSEYVNSQSINFFDNLQAQSYSLFSYEKNIEDWDWDLQWGTKEKVRYHYYVETVSTNRISKEKMVTREEVPAGSPYDYVEAEYYTIDQLYGTVTVYMNCDIRKYKADVVQNMKDSIVGMEIVMEESTDEGTTYNKVVVDQDKADEIVEETIMNYFVSYISQFAEGTIMPGYTGIISSNGWDYNTEQSGSSITNAFWAYALSQRAIIDSLPYAKSSGSVADYNCTMFAAVFFNDVYGFSALRGNGVQMADNLITDCGSDKQNACPVKFNRSYEVAPGAIVSLYPNHVAVVTEVKENGNVVIAEANIGDNHGVVIGNEYSSIYAYAAYRGLTIKSIAIPEQD